MHIPNFIEVSQVRKMTSMTVPVPALRETHGFGIRRGIGRIVHALDVLAGHRSANRERMKLKKRSSGVAGTCRDFA